MTTNQASGTADTGLAEPLQPLLDVCALAHAGFAEIEALAQAALLAMESADAWRDPEWLAGVLGAIKGAANVHDNCICVKAEALDPGEPLSLPVAARRRRQAHDAARMDAYPPNAANATSRQEAQQ